MKHFVWIAAAILASCTVGKYKQSHTMNGNWKPIFQEMNGRVLPAAVFQSQLLTILDSVYILKAESVDKGILRMANGQMDIFGKEGVNRGKHFTARYEQKKDTLRICYNLKGDAYPTEFSTKGGGLLFLSVFVKQQQP